MSEADELYEMVNLVPRLTGLPMTVWVSPRARPAMMCELRSTGRTGVRRSSPMPQRSACVRRLITGQLSPADLHHRNGRALQRLQPLSPAIPP